MKPLTVSHIVGYDSHLPIKKIKLPLKYLSSSYGKDASEIYTSRCLGHSEFIDISSQIGHLFSLVQVGLTKDMKRIILTPILTDEPTSLGLQYQSLEFQFPHPIIGKGTFTYYFVPSSSDEEPYIAMDVLDESYLLISFRIELNDFLVGNFKNRLALDNFSEWVNISVPYSFELRSSPFLIKALDELNIIVSMNDGGLLHFKRSAPLSSIDIFNFSDLAPLVSLNFVGNLFSNPGKLEATIGGISSNAAVDIAKLNEKEFVTLSLNKSVKVYDINSHKQIRNCNDLSSSKGKIEWVTNVPNKYFQSHVHFSQKSLSLMLPIDGDLGVGREPPYAFANWDISNGKLENFEYLELVDQYSNTYERHSADTKNLRIQDFQIVEETDSVAYYILYKSNTYSEVVCFNQARSTREITSVTRSLPQQASVFAELSSHRETPYYVNTVFNSGMFDKRMVTSALDIFTQNSENIPNLDDSTSLRQKVMRTMTFFSKTTGISESSSWYKFALICFEFRRSSHEVLSITVQPQYILCSEVNGVGIYREAHCAEIRVHESNKDELMNLTNLVSCKLSAKTFKRILEEAGAVTSIDKSEASNLASKYLAGKIPDEEISFLMSQLDMIPNVVDQINHIIELSDTSLSLDYASGHGVIPAAGEGVGLLSMLLTIETFESIKKSHESLLIHLFVLLLLCEVNDAIIEFMNMIIKKLRDYDLMSEVFNICFSTTGSISMMENSTVSLKENSLFWTVSVKKNPQLQYLIQTKNYNVAFDYYSNHVLSENSDKMILEVVIDLLNREESKLVLNQFVPKMNHDSPINSFLSGITYLLNGKYGQFHDTLIEYRIFEFVNNHTTRAILLANLEGNTSIYEFLTGIYIGESDSLITKSNYYHQLSELVNRHERSSSGKYNAVNISERETVLELSLKLEANAIKILQSSPDVSSYGHIALIYLRNHFDIALDLKDFSQAANSLSQIKHITDKLEFHALLTKLIKSLIKCRQFEILFSAKDITIFSANYLIVDSILLEIANDDLVLFNAVKCYELLYSWRLLGPAPSQIDEGPLVDKRAAAEALYIFITRFQSEKDNLGSDSQKSEDFQQFKLKILELYKIILTTLNSFGLQEEKWIRKKGAKKSLNITTLAELNLEYLRWLKDLEGDFMET
ncbi:hypothetical protein JCM33374_g5377 [Metschnikowia sp. JCM 33374]|nr:hypothetical protein JCM33374_g5377 [Metschnikowia sp. JCM 33374]